MEPIILDELGATLVPRLDDPNKQYMPDYLGNHEFCHDPSGLRGLMRVYHHGSGHNAILCSRCHLRIVVPSKYLPLVVTPETFKSLREWFIVRIEKIKQFKAQLERTGEVPRWVSPSVFGD